MFLVFGNGIQLVVVQHTGITVEELGILGGVLGIRDWCLVGADAIGEDYSKGIWHFGVCFWFLGARI